MDNKTPHSQSTHEQRQLIESALKSVAAVLPSQAPLRDFVHHNTLHSYEHLPFHDAVNVASGLNGARAYYSRDKWQEIFASGRITSVDLETALAAQKSLKSEDAIVDFKKLQITRGCVYQVAMLHTFHRLSQAQLNWEVEDLLALERFQADVPVAQCERLLLHSMQASPALALQALWDTCLQQLGLSYFTLHPEDVMELQPEQAELLLTQMLLEADDERDVRLGLEFVLQREYRTLASTLFDELGEKFTLRGLLLKLTGVDVLQDVQSLLVRQMGNYLDIGVSSLHVPNAEEGFYAAWRLMARHDLAWFFEELPQWKGYLNQMPAEPIDAIISELQLIGIEEQHWSSYLQHLALELPGWSGMFNWRASHENYSEYGVQKVSMADYLAVRLIVENVYSRRLCGRLWGIESSVDSFQQFFKQNKSEYLVRYELFNTQMPDFLASLSQRLVDTEEVIHSENLDWSTVANLIWVWKHRQSLDTVSGHSIFGDAWHLYRLCQHLGVCAQELASLSRDQVEEIIISLQTLDQKQSGKVWLEAYELHYRNELLSGLTAKFRTKSSSYADVPQAQVVCCMDDREEGFRRQLEEVNPAINTYGAAAFFDLDLAWQGLDDSEPIKLCPVPMTPAHLVQERPLASEAHKADIHQGRHARMQAWYHLFYQELRRNLLVTVPTVLLMAPTALAALFSRVLFPRVTGNSAQQWEAQHEGVVTTDVEINNHNIDVDIEGKQRGYTDEEQVSIVAGFLNKISLTTGFSPLVVLLGHGSSSENNPHFSAYGCGACSGRNSGPNGRVFAAMANRIEVREQLRHQGIHIPSDTWFVGAEHNTCTDRVTLFDRHHVPSHITPKLDALYLDLQQSGENHAKERCRKFMAAPLGLSPAAAYQHVLARALDISQPRPELGHATVAAAIVGRRALSSELFLDRRAFLISYDPDTDHDGAVLEETLLLTTPVGAGIALEYYFSSIDPYHYGSGSKVTHNIVGLFAVMDGAYSDLRTGLPKQMIEVHEAMRLQVVVEATPERLASIMARQPLLQRLIDNEWLVLMSIDPTSGDIQIYEPKIGFTQWQEPLTPVPNVSSSIEWCGHSREPCPPALVTVDQYDV